MTGNINFLTDVYEIRNIYVGKAIYLGMDVINSKWREQWNLVIIMSFRMKLL